MPRFYRHHYARYGHPRQPFGGAIWLIGLGLLFMTGFWWPGIFILIGLSLIFNSFWRQPEPPTFLQPERPVIPPVMTPPTPPLIIAQSAPTPAAPIQRADLLPATCPNCGGPARTSEVKWLGLQSAACAYCGSTLPLKKS
jgi:hypothetical protein